MKQFKIQNDLRPIVKEAMDHFDCSFFYYNLPALRDHLKKINDSVGKHARLWYATKANPLSRIIMEMRNAGFGIDVSAQGELDHALKHGFSPKEIISTGPSKSRKYLRSLVDLGLEVVVLESINQALWLNKIAEEKKVKQKVLIRVQLTWSLGHSVLGGDEITPFGIDPSEWESFDPKACEWLDIVGFHVFQWGNILEADYLKNIWFEIAKKVCSLSNKMGVDMKILDLGGGLGIPYSPMKKPLNIEEIAQLLKELKNHFKLKEIWMELGRYAIGEFGGYCTQVIDKKKVRGAHLLILDGGINHIVRPALTGESFPCELFRQSNEDLESFQLHGPLCTALDKLGVFALPADVGPGDWVIFHQAGAYGFTESMPYFLCHNIPGEIVIDKGSFEILRGIQTAAHWLK